MKQARIGSISYINSLPIDFGILSGAVKTEHQLVRGFPEELNRLMLAHELDLSPVSALFYAEHANELVLIPEFSISSESGVKSVLLISKIPIEEMNHSEILVTHQGKTTPALLRVLFKSYYGFDITLKKESIDVRAALRGEIDQPFILIGDDALSFAFNPRSSTYKIYDLAELWNRWKDKPFVFALWVARKSWAEQNPDLLREAVETLKSSREWGIQHFDEVIRHASHKLGSSESLAAQYFNCLRYDYGTDLKNGYNEFIREVSALDALSTQGELEINARIVG